jgi:tartrate dehydrogenase/decarboxylase/D-malate dehydrogenase
MRVSQRTYRIAAIPGDGIGQEVLPEGLRSLRAAGRRFGFEVDIVSCEFASCDYYHQHGQMMPDDWRDRVDDCDAILFGAVGWPDTVPDHISLWGSILEFRRTYDQYVGLRPVRLMPGVPSPLAGRGPGDIDFVVVRENTEGEYSSVGGRMFTGTERETVLQETIMTRIGVDRILRYAFELSGGREARHLTSATKSNGIAISMPYWDERVAAMAPSFPDVAVDKFHIDALVAQVVLHPDRFDVIVASNPEGAHPSLFEPVHGSAPDIAGQGIANPVGQIWATQMMLEHLGEAAAAAALLTAIEAGLARPETRTADIGGSADTVTAGSAIADAVGSA